MQHLLFIHCMFWIVFCQVSAKRQPRERVLCTSLRRKLMTLCFLACRVGHMTTLLQVWIICCAHYFFLHINSFYHSFPMCSFYCHTSCVTVCESWLPPPRRICNRHCLFVCQLATLHRNLWTVLHEIFRKGWQWANEQMIKFWWQSKYGSGSRHW